MNKNTGNPELDHHHLPKEKDVLRSLLTRGICPKCGASMTKKDGISKCDKCGNMYINPFKKQNTNHHDD